MFQQGQKSHEVDVFTNPILCGVSVDKTVSRR